MKTIKLNSNGSINVKRVEDAVAVTLVAKGGGTGWEYCAKKEWKVRQPKASKVEAKASVASVESLPQVSDKKDNSKGKDKKSKYARKQVGKTE